MPLKPHISPDCFIHVPESLGTSSQWTSSESVTVLFFITGNPGLIGYYHLFLSVLATTSLSDSSSRSDSSSSEADKSRLNGLSHPDNDEEGRNPRNPVNTSDCVIAGFSLAGFEIERPLSADDVGVEVAETLVSERNGEIKSLRRQVEITLDRIDAVVRGVEALEGDSRQVKREREIKGQESGDEKRRKKLRVILMGHSVGAYIALEIVRMWQGRKSRGREESVVDKRPKVDLDRGLHMRCPELETEIIGAILLTPTIVDIAKSRSGKIAKPLLDYFPSFPAIAQGLVWGLTRLLPDRLLRGIVQRATGMQGQPLRTTVCFLRSKMGVQQSLAMAREEMKEINEDKWGDEVWGVAKTAGTAGNSDSSTDGAPRVCDASPKLIFYFAHRDHWVADATREEIMQLRGTTEEENRCEMVVEEAGRLEHGWCISQSESVAVRVQKWFAALLSDSQ